MKINKNILLVSGAVAAVLASYFFIIPYYKRKRLSNVDTAKAAIKLAPNKDLIYFAQKLPLAVWDMTNSEINAIYSFMYDYIAKDIPIPQQLTDKVVLIAEKYKLFR